MNFMQEVLNQHIEKVVQGKDQLLKDSLSQHFGLALTEATYKRLTRVQFEDEPYATYYFLDSEHELDWSKLVIKYYEDPFKFMPKNVNDQITYTIGFEYWSPLLNHPNPPK